MYNLRLFLVDSLRVPWEDIRSKCPSLSSDALLSSLVRVSEQYLKMRRSKKGKRKEEEVEMPQVLEDLLSKLKVLAPVQSCLPV